MSKLVASATISLIAATSHTASAVEEAFQIDPSHTAVIFGISHLNYSVTYGRFNDVRGDFALDRSDPSKSRFQLLIKTESIDTNDPKRDQHLRNADFFNAAQFPLISFKSKRVAVKQTEQGVVYVVDGDLQMHGVTRRITLNLRKLGEGPGPMKKHRAGFVCETSLNRSDFGMKTMLPMIGDAVSIIVSFEGIRQE